MIEIERNDVRLKEDLAQGGNMIVDFWAEWCRPCKMLRPILTKVEEDMGACIKFYSVEVEENKAYGNEFHIRNIPALVMFRGGKEIGRSVGLKNAHELEELLSSIFELGEQSCSLVRKAETEEERKIPVASFIYKGEKRKGITALIAKMRGKG